MFILVFLFLLGTVVTVKSDQPEVEMFTGDINNGTEVLVCRTKYFKTTDIILNIKINRCVLTEDDGVKTSGVKPHGDGTFWRRDHVTISTSDMSDYSCEVIHAASRFRVEKVWDPDSGGRGRIISSKFIDTSKPEVVMFTINSKDHNNVILTCVASGFYPNNITLNIRRDGRILTREDGVESSGVCSIEDDTFSRIVYVEIKKSDKATFICEVIHAASGSRVEKVWDHHLPTDIGAGGDNIADHPVNSGDHTVIICAVVGVLVLVVVPAVVLVYLCRKRILGAAVNNAAVTYTPEAPLQTVTSTSGNNNVNTPLLEGKTGSKASLDTNNSFDSGVLASGSSGSNVSSSNVSENEETSLRLRKEMS